jgi:hypothetical protein
MKKILLIIVFLTALSSCSAEDDTNIETTSVSISTENEFNTSTAGKNVQRGSLFAWISEMQIVAVHSGGYVSTTNYTLVANGTAGADTKFFMDAVMIGNNSFTASSKTTETEKLETAQVSISEAFTTTIANLKARNPYALYTSTNPVNYTITPGTVQNVSIPMSTYNSRFIALFTTEDIAGGNSGNIVTITSYVNGVLYGPSATCSKSKNATFYWSNKNSIAGKSIYFKIVNNDRGTLDTYYTTSILLKASNTVKIRYTIKDNSFTTTPM